MSEVFERGSLVGRADRQPARPQRTARAKRGARRGDSLKAAHLGLVAAVIFHLLFKQLSGFGFHFRSKKVAVSLDVPLILAMLADAPRLLINCSSSTCGRSFRS